MKKKDIVISEKLITIKSLPLGKYAELLKALKTLPKNIRNLQDTKTESIVELLPTLIGESWQDFINIFAIATPLTKEQIEAISLNEAVDITLAIIEVNEFREIYGKIKKVAARPELKS